MRNHIVFLVIIFTLTASASLSAAQVRSIRADGAIILEDGSAIRLAGIEIARHGLRLLPALLAGKELELEYHGSDHERAFVYIRTLEIDMPAKGEFAPVESRQMVNEILLAMGAATVSSDPAAKSSNHAKFLKLEDQARTSGQGLWSYLTQDEAEVMSK